MSPPTVFFGRLGSPSRSMCALLSRILVLCCLFMSIRNPIRGKNPIREKKGLSEENSQTAPLRYHLSHIHPCHHPVGCFDPLKQNHSVRVHQQYQTQRAIANGERPNSCSIDKCWRKKGPKSRAQNAQERIEQEKNNNKNWEQEVARKCWTRKKELNTEPINQFTFPKRSTHSSHQPFGRREVETARWKRPKLCIDLTQKRVNLKNVICKGEI